MAMTIQYRQLNPFTAEIRLVRILPADLGSQDEHDVVACQLEYISLDALTKTTPTAPLKWDSSHVVPETPSALGSGHELEFAALSYTWGGPEDTRAIVVDGHPVLVRSNLEAALRELRNKEPTRQGLRIWIDALCINQEDVPERNREVKRMRQIYQNARDVVVWLGEEADGSEKAMEMIRVLAESCVSGRNEELMARIRETPDFFGFGAWRALGQLLGRTYWDRVWIIQEITMGNPNTPVLCGGGMVTWRQFHSAIYTFMELASTNIAFVFNNVERECREAGLTYTGLKRNKIIHLWEEQAVQAGTGKAQYMPVLDLGRKSFATDDRDKVYGLMGLLPAGVAALITPDYGQGVNEAFGKFATAWIKSRNDLELLEQCTGARAGLPSWVPDWTNGDHYRLFSGTTCHYHAGPSGPPLLDFSADGLELTVRGLMVGELDGLGVGYRHTQGDTDESELVQQSRATANGYASDQGLRDAVWRTFIGNRDPVGRPVPDTFAALLDCPLVVRSKDKETSLSRGYKAFAYIMSKNKDLAIAGKPLGNFFPNEGETAPPKECENALERIFRLQRCRKLASTVSGHLGLVPLIAQRGDLVFVLQGCNVPMILREAGYHRYQVVGGAYLHGFMDGEATRELEDSTAEMQKVVLC